MSEDLRRRLGKKRAFKCREQAAFLDLWRTCDILEHYHDDLFAEHGLSAPQYNVLRILRGSGERGATISQVQHDLVTRASDVSRLVARLEEKGFVTREAAHEDGRATLVRISGAGLMKLASLDEKVLQCHRRQLGHLNRKELNQLIALLDKARQPHERPVHDERAIN